MSIAPFEFQMELVSGIGLSPQPFFLADGADTFPLAFRRREPTSADRTITGP